VGSERVREAYRRLFTDEAGALRPSAIIVLDDLLEFALFFKDQKTISLEPCALAALEGSRSVVRRVLRLSQAGGPLMKKLLEESTDE
jgi:hypothetical protein